MVKPPQSLERVVRLCCCVKDSGGTVVRINELMRGFRAGLEAAMDSSGDWMEFWIRNPMVLFFLLHRYTLWITAIGPIVDL